MSRADETLLSPDPPLWEVPGWRARFGISAGITGRGPDEAAPFDLGLWTAEPVGEVMRRWRRFRGALADFAGETMAHQVHGARVLWHPRPGEGWTVIDGADGHATSAAGHLLLVTVADCIPVYLVAPQHGAIAILHAGWRGTAARILDAGLQVLREVAGVGPSAVVMHCGVGICGDCYEVGPEVAQALGTEVPSTGRPHADLRSVLARQAEALGVGEVSVSGHCSAHERRHFFSHRGSGGRDGRMVAWIGMLPAGGRPAAE